MDIEKLIERLKNAAGGPDGIKMCQQAATALSTLQIENQALRNAANGFNAENEKLRAELEQAREDNKKLSAAMMELKCKGDISKMTLVYELEYNSALSHASVEDIARIVFDGLMREHLRVRGQKED